MYCEVLFVLILGFIFVKVVVYVLEEMNMVCFLWYIFKIEGVFGFWKGWIFWIFKVVLVCVIMISSYEVSKRVFRGVNK